MVGMNTSKTLYVAAKARSGPPVYEIDDLLSSGVKVSEPKATQRLCVLIL